MACVLFLELSIELWRDALTSSEPIPGRKMQLSPDERSVIVACNVRFVMNLRGNISGGTGYRAEPLFYSETNSLRRPKQSDRYSFLELIWRP